MERREGGKREGKREEWGGSRGWREGAREGERERERDVEICRLSFDRDVTTCGQELFDLRKRESKRE